MRDQLTARLMQRFDDATRADWPWFEDGLAYDNAKLAHALITTGHATGRKPVLDRGLSSLQWLVDQQTSESGDFRPIGSNGFYPRSGSRARFDQQPLEAHAMLSACL